jgi:hypothetical protein
MVVDYVNSLGSSSSFRIVDAQLFLVLFLADSTVRTYAALTHSLEHVLRSDRCSETKNISLGHK